MVSGWILVAGMTAGACKKDDAPSDSSGDGDGDAGDGDGDLSEMGTATSFDAVEAFRESGAHFQW